MSKPAILASLFAVFMITGSGGGVSAKNRASKRPAKKKKTQETTTP